MPSVTFPTILSDESSAIDSTVETTQVVVAEIMVDTTEAAETQSSLPSDMSRNNTLNALSLDESFAKAVNSSSNKK